ncbi:MAG: 2-oxoacid:acceptor oxidoreductase subunit alpha [Deltaproteobacteria bacterium]
MRNEANIRVTGGAGQGVHTVGTLLCRIAVSAGHHFHLTQDYMSRIRGGRNSQTVRIGMEPVRAGREKAEILLAVNPDHLPQVLPGLSEEGFAIADAADPAPALVRAPLKELAASAGSPILANVAGTGAVAFALGYPSGHADRLFSELFRGEFREKNRSAFRLGWEWAREHLPPDPAGRFRLPPGRFAPRSVMSGNEALALGAIAGGCTFGCGYPMTPGTGILSVLADEGGKTGLLFEQAEDEIAALNMAIGAAYTGARSLVATSGGGFALMAEALSLAGMMETPVVIALAMRPGPATGMPTRTAQGDLEFALHAGHGEFPRLVLSPGSVEEAFDLAQHAMDAAERFQVPVILLTDQHLADTVVDIDPASLVVRPVRRHLARGGAVPRTPEGKYLRYALTESGVSPMAVPGEPGITVVADSDEHTEDGHLTEDHGVRIGMVKKRLRKGGTLARETLPPLFSGPPNGDLLLIGFGSTKEAVAEARGILAGEGTRAGSVHLRQVWPFPAKEMAEILPRYRTCLTVENNATGQLARLIRRETGLSVTGSILRYDGLPFTPAGIADEAGRRR